MLMLSPLGSIRKPCDYLPLKPLTPANGCEWVQMNKTKSALRHMHPTLSRLVSKMTQNQNASIHSLLETGTECYLHQQNGTKPNSESQA